MSALPRDLRYGLRMLAKSPGFTLAAALVLALGIGANTAIFSLVDGILLRPLPYPNANRLVTLNDGYVPKGAFVGLRDLDRSTQFMGFVPDEGFNLLKNGAPIRLHGSAVSADFFTVLGVAPRLGRGLAPGDDTPGRDPMAVLSHALWQREFASDPNIIGHWIKLNDEEREVVGVMPAGFAYPSASTQIWVPLRLAPGNVDDYWISYDLQVVGRLRPEASLMQARAELGSILPHVRAMFPYPVPKDWANNFPLIPLLDSMVALIRARLLAMLGAVGLVLLIACVTVANLLLVRATARQGEIAVRIALGADRRRLVQQFTAETMPLALGGGALGWLFAWLGTPLLLHILPRDTPRLVSVSLNLGVFGFTAAVAILVGLIFGLLPALRTDRSGLDGTLRAGALRAGMGRERHRLSTALVIGEIAIAALVVIGAGLLMKSLWRLAHVSPGFRASHLVTAEVTPTQAFCGVVSRCVDFYDEVVRRVDRDPGVQEAAVVNVVPLSGAVPVGAIMLEGHPLLPGQTVPLTWESVVSPGFVRTLGIPLVAGRSFTAADVAGNTRVAMVSVSLAQRYWPGRNPVGKHVYTLSAEGATPWTVVGETGDVREFQLQDNPSWYTGETYFPYAQAAADRSLLANPAMSLVVRTTSNSAQVAADLRRIVKSVNPYIPVSKEQAMGDIVAENIATSRATTWLFAIFAALALILSAVGVYGVVAYSVVQRTHEVGVRMALGAQSGDILRLVLGHGANMAFIGVAIGVGTAFALMRSLGSLLYGVSASDPATFAGAAVLLILVTLAACYIPARHAMRVDPTVALRYE